MTSIDPLAPPPSCTDGRMLADLGQSTHSTCPPIDDQGAHLIGFNAAGHGIYRTTTMCGQPIEPLTYLRTACCGATETGTDYGPACRHCYTQIHATYDVVYPPPPASTKASARTSALSPRASDRRSSLPC